VNAELDEWAQHQQDGEGQEKAERNDEQARRHSTRLHGRGARVIDWHFRSFFRWAAR
jgi:hypothetical protein